MKKFWITLSALGVLAGVASAAGIPNVSPYGGGLGYYNQQSGQIVDPNGNMLGSEAYKDRDLFLNTLAIADTNSVLNGCDSTMSGIYTAPYGRLFLHIKVAQVAATGGFANLTWVRLAIQIEGGYAATEDTSTFVPWYAPTSGAASDSTTYDYRTVGTNATAHPGTEFVVTIPFTDNIASKWGNTHGAYIELVNSRGLPYWAPYTKIRARLIATSAVTSTTIPPYVDLKIRLIGRPW